MKDIDTVILSDLIVKQETHSDEQLREVALTYSPSSWIDSDWEWKNDNAFAFACLVVRIMRSLRGDEPLELVTALASNLQMVVQWVDEDMVDVALILEEEFYNKKLRVLKEYRQGLEASYGTHPDVDYGIGSACNQLCDSDRNEESLCFDLTRLSRKVDRFLAQ